MLINAATLNSFYVGLSAVFQGALSTAESQYQKIAMVVPSTTAANAYPWLGSLSSMQKWVGERTIRNLKAHKYTIDNEKFELTIAVSRDHLEDDQIGIYNPMFADMGAQAGIHPNQLVFELLQKGHQSVCYDGQYFFDTDHPVGDGSVSNSLGDDSSEPWYLMCTTRPVKPIIFQTRRPYTLTRKDSPTDDNVFMRGEYLYGVDARVAVGFGLWQCAVRCTSPLTDATYAEARALMRSYHNDEGVPLGLVPNLLVVPGTLEAAGLELLNSQLVKGGESNKWYNTAELLVCPWLG